MTGRRLPLAAPLLVVGLAGCGGTTLTAGAVEERAADALEEQVGVRPEISCPESLEAEVGASTECTLTAGDDPAEYPVTVTVSSVDGDSTTLDVAVGDTPRG